MRSNLTTPTDPNAGLLVAVRQKPATPGRKPEGFAARETAHFPDATSVASDGTKPYLRALRKAEQTARNMRQNRIGTRSSERPLFRLPAVEHHKAEDRAYVALAFLCFATLVSVLGTLLPRARNWHEFVEFVHWMFA
jgi:hypothetical protein